jgi:endonuclease III
MARKAVTGGSREAAALDPRKQVRKVIELLDGYYGRPVWAARHDAVEELVYTVLSQNTAGYRAAGCRATLSI